MEPLVSILIPAHNAQAWIKDTIESALAQTWPRKEIIVVDDGSKDETFNVAQQFASRTVKVFTQKNQGASTARNSAFTACQGDFIQWLDADDLLGPGKVIRQMQAAQRVSPRTLLSSAWAPFIYRTSKTQFTASPLWEDLAPVEWLLRKMGQNLHMQTSTWLVSRELTETAGPWDTRLTLDDDGEYFCRVLLASEGTHFVPEAKTYYRTSGFSSLSKVDGSAKKLESQFLSMQLHIGYLRSLEESPRVYAACLYYLNTWLPYFYPERMDIVEQARELARSLGGGTLPIPLLSWKYAWLRALFGWSAAKRAQFRYNHAKFAWKKFWDNMFFQLEGRKGPSASSERNEQAA
jgi:glycosyltransferase involved in cell wall biosynthesis